MNWLLAAPAATDQGETTTTVTTTTWYTNPLWLGLLVVGLLVMALIIGVAGRSGKGGGTTIVQT